MLIGRVIGWVLVLSALTVLVLDIFLWFAYGRLPPIATGELWHLLSPNSLLLAQPAIQRHVAAWLWDPVVVTVLLWPSELVLVVPGLLLIWACREHERRGRRR
jgi:hypothetical protein